MTALTADIQRVLQSGRDYAPISVQVLASTTIYDGSAVMSLAASHYARPIVASATGPQFLGFSRESVVNSSATQAEAKTVLIAQQGKLQVPNTTAFFANGTGAGGIIGTADVGKQISMSDDGTGFNITVTNNVVIGKIDTLDLINGQVTIAFQSFAMRSV